MKFQNKSYVNRCTDNCPYSHIHINYTTKYPSQVKYLTFPKPATIPPIFSSHANKMNKQRIRQSNKIVVLYVQSAVYTLCAYITIELQLGIHLQIH